MPDSVLDILKLVLLVLLYLFFARVLWAVWSEVRQPRNARGPVDYAPAPMMLPAGDDSGATRREPRPARGRGTRPGRLVVLEPKERRGTAYAVTGTLGIGRDEGNAIQITDDSYLSGHHARLWLEAGNLVLDDLGSRNGTFLNGTRVTETRMVRAGDRIQIGYTVFEAQ
jgi:pSer/pThr/pTyr-binding forkhead associated (FHA) protein